MIIDTEEHPDEMVHRAKVLSTGASILMKLEYNIHWTCRYVHQPRSSPNPMLLRFLWKFHHIGMISD